MEMNGSNVPGKIVLIIYRKNMAIGVNYSFKINRGEVFHDVTQEDVKCLRCEVTNISNSGRSI